MVWAEGWTLHTALYLSAHVPVGHRANHPELDAVERPVTADGVHALPLHRTVRSLRMVPRGPGVH